MSKMIKTASGFQHSVNIAFDLHDHDKLRSFIPTKSAMALLKDILQSTQKNASNRARILIGAYGKGKSHIVLSILSLLMKENRKYFVHLNKKIAEDKELSQLVDNYYEDRTKLLPVLINGTTTSLSQSFILSLQRTLKENDLLDIMPETNYTAAIRVIEKWGQEYPSTLKKFEMEIESSADSFIERLADYDVDAYRLFEDVYPSLTAGSTFNPFVGFDVVELYESVVSALRRNTDWTGIYIVYDEFSKYLESSISSANVSDTKMLQDLAEKCSRSGNNQLHLMLISHKEISNYIDSLPKQKTDGWRGIAERFEHVLLNNNFSQIYEIISTVIQKDSDVWKEFKRKRKNEFAALVGSYRKHPLFSELNPNDAENVIYECFPLHPVSTFILPRLSERIAQNERTLFTFLSAQAPATLWSYLRNYNDRDFRLVTPDAIFDYFEILFKKEAYGSEIHDLYVLTSRALDKISNKNSLEAKIVKTLCLLYILQQYEKIKPTKDELFNVYKLAGYREQEITSAFENLIEKQFVVYLRQSNSFLKIKETSGVNIDVAIKNEIERQRPSFVLKDVLNECNPDEHLYPSRYNDEREMVRWFDFCFVTESEVLNADNWDDVESKMFADGLVLGIIIENQGRMKKLKDAVYSISSNFANVLFVLPKQYEEIEVCARKYSAVRELRNRATGDNVVVEEYQVILDDLAEILRNFIAGYIRAERGKVAYIHAGENAQITRKADLSEKMSCICERVYSNSPVIKNEAVNKTELTSVMQNARGKVLTALLRSELEENLGLVGFGPDVFIMRSCLVSTGIVNFGSAGNILNLDISPKNDSAKIRFLIDTMVSFVTGATKRNGRCFAELYEKLLNPKSKIGARKGIIPIYLAAVIHKYKKSISIQNGENQVPINAQTLDAINECPENYSISFVEWDSEKEMYVKNLKKVFASSSEMAGDDVVNMMRRWYISLPKYTKEMSLVPSTLAQKQRCNDFLKAVCTPGNDQDLLFLKLPKIFTKNGTIDKSTINAISDAKKHFDECVDNLNVELISFVKKIFANPLDKKQLSQMSVMSVCADWLARLDKKVCERVFDDGSDRILTLFSEKKDSESDFINALARIVVGLHIVDWNAGSPKLFEDRIIACKNNVEQFANERKNEKKCAYQFSFDFDKKNVVVKSFDRVKLPTKANLLRNKLTDALDTMGQSMSAAEKRQVLVDLLQELCGGAV